MADTETTGTTDTGSDVLRAQYEAVTDLVTGLDEHALLTPTRCTGWTAQDLLFHVLLDARRALVTFATPGAAETCTHLRVATQGHVLAVPDFVATLVAETTVQRTLDGLLGAPSPRHWDAVAYALKGTGRLPAVRLTFGRPIRPALPQQLSSMSPSADFSALVIVS